VSHVTHTTQSTKSHCSVMHRGRGDEPARDDGTEALLVVVVANVAARVRFAMAMGSEYSSIYLFLFFLLDSIRSFSIVYYLFFKLSNFLTSTQVLLSFVSVHLFLWVRIYTPN
jgi:hypothetical protein